MTTLPLNSAAKPERLRGFTLIEMMIVVAIIGILASIAYPSYIKYVQKGRRADAKSALLDYAARQERYISTRNVYADTPDKLGYSETAYPVKITSGGQSYYQIELTLSAAKTSYTATATRLTGAQFSDACGTYSLTDLGVQTNTGNSETSANCW